MLLRNFIITLGFLASSVSAQAQMERTIYQVFTVDSTTAINLDLAGLYEIHTWAGNSVLVETNIQIWHASPEILTHLIETGRYDVQADTLSAEEITIKTKVRDRKPLKFKDVECTEIATAKVFVPDTFIVAEDKKRITREKQ
ncbi:MAG: hypothetical protein IT270_04065 [Saprospiraceae bacterium]|nr:hypothetical protein [Saprospiraceae bacterium]